MYNENSGDGEEAQWLRALTLLPQYRHGGLQPPVPLFPGGSDILFSLPWAPYNIQHTFSTQNIHVGKTLISIKRILKDLENNREPDERLRIGAL